MCVKPEWEQDKSQMRSQNLPLFCHSYFAQLPAVDEPQTASPCGKKKSIKRSSFFTSWENVSFVCHHSILAHQCGNPPWQKLIYLPYFITYILKHLYAFVVFLDSEIDTYKHLLFPRVWEPKSGLRS